MLDIINSFHDTVDGLALRTRQVISPDYLDDLQVSKDCSLERLPGEMHRVASVPVAIVERWLKEGFNIYQEPAKAILARLRREDLDGFITTKRRI